MNEEEVYWQQRGSEKWILQGDANTTFFHLVANGRRRKKMILNLEEEGRQIVDPKEIQDIIYSFYKKLFGYQPERRVRLADRVWEVSGRLSEGDNVRLTRPFTEEEVGEVISNLKANSATGPDGFSYTFYKSCWGIIKSDFMKLMEDFYEGNLDLGRLNYGAITLIPKVRDAFNVKQFRPIYLLNVSFKIFSNILMNRLTEVADKLEDKSQTAFIKGRYILDGVVVLHETLHELKRKKQKGMIFKIDFEKAYDSVKWGL